jgi:hypothetical protein
VHSLVAGTLFRREEACVLVASRPAKIRRLLIQLGVLAD